MEPTTKKQQIFENLEMQNHFFNPAKTSGSDYDFQFVFKEAEGIYPFFFSVRNKKSTLIEGETVYPTCTITTDFDTWEKIGGGYTSPFKAMKERKFKISGNTLAFIFKFRKMYSGNFDWEMPKTLFSGNFEIPEIKKVLVLSCSPRTKNGATHLFTEHFIKGMENVGADVEVIFPSQLKINPCIGCFSCWIKSSKECIYHDKDDMKIILEKYHEVDLVVWTTPVYHYFGTTVMKTVMDRLFINSDPHFLNIDGHALHPRKWERLPYYAVLSVGGFPDKDIFNPIHSAFYTLAKHTGIKLIAEIYRHTCMTFLLENNKMKKKDEILEAVELAGYETIKYQKVSKRTKRIAEQDFIKIPQIASAVNFTMDKVQQQKVFPFKRKGKDVTVN